MAYADYWSKGAEYPGTDFDGVLEAFDAAEEAERLEPVPAGPYVAELAEAKLITSGKGTPGFELVLTIAEGEHAGRKLWARYWLSARALGLAKAELARAGFANAAALRNPPTGARYQLRATLRQGQDGAWHNEAKDVVPLEEEFTPSSRAIAAADGVAPSSRAAEPGGTSPKAVVPDGLLEG